MMALMQRPIDLDYNGTTQLPTQAATPRCTVGMVSSSLWLRCPVECCGGESPIRPVAYNV
jgi:hypothetical protein